MERRSSITNQAAADQTSQPSALDRGGAEGLSVDLAPRNSRHLRLANPIMIASGTLGYDGYGRGITDEMDLGRLGAVTPKTVTRQPLEGSPEPRWDPPSYRRALEDGEPIFLNSIGLANPGIDAALAKLAPQWSRWGATVVLSLAGDSVDQFGEMTALTQGVVGFQALELNLSCPNIHNGAIFSHSAALTAAVVGAVRANTELPVLAKLAPNVPDVTEIARAAVDAGADALTIANTVPAMRIDVESRRPVKPNLLVLALIGAPAVFLFAPLIEFFPIGLGLKMLVISCVFTILLFGILLPVFGFYKVKGTLSYLFYLLALGFFISAHLTSGFSSEKQKPNSLIYYMDADIGKAYWATFDKILDEWTKGYLGASPKKASTYIDNASGSKYNSGYSFASEAPYKPIPLFEVVLNKDTIINETRSVIFTIVPERYVNQISLYTSEETRFNSLSFNGKSMTLQSDSQRIKSKELVRYFVSDNDSLEVVFSISKNSKINFTVMEYSYDLLDHPQFSINKRSENMMPKPFIITDAIVVKKNINIDSLSIKVKDSIVVFN